MKELYKQILFFLIYVLHKNIFSHNIGVICRSNVVCKTKGIYYNNKVHLNWTFLLNEIYNWTYYITRRLNSSNRFAKIKCCLKKLIVLFILYYCNKHIIIIIRLGQLYTDYRDLPTC